MTPAEEIIERIATVLERQAAAQQKIADELAKITNILDLASDHPEDDEDLEPVAFNIRAVGTE